MKTFITGNDVRSWYEWLINEDTGCCHMRFASDDDYEYSICMGWTNAFGDGNDFSVAWKIGRQPYNSCMRSDLDIDFEMPYSDESGEVDDTLTAVTPDDLDYDEIAAVMNREANRVKTAWIG